MLTFCCCDEIPVFKKGKIYCGLWFQRFPSMVTWLFGSGLWWGRMSCWESCGIESSGEREGEGAPWPTSSTEDPSPKVYTISQWINPWMKLEPSGSTPSWRPTCEHCCIGNQLFHTFAFGGHFKYKVYNILFSFFHLYTSFGVDVWFHSSSVFILEYNYFVRVSQLISFKY